MAPHRFLLIALLAILPSIESLATAADTAVDFNRDVRPILSDKCFACHGPDASHAKGNLRLDQSESAFEKKRSGATPITPGKPDASELIARINTEDADDLMPPADAHKKLSAAEKETLKKWITQGATYEMPWAYVPPKVGVLPKVKRADWPANFIDAYILSRLEAQGLTPSPDAEKVTLIRRVTFDLTGLPPTPGDIDAFLKDTSGNAYEKLVDRLLNSPHFGERMAVWWLDLVRYADTVGYHGDQTHRSWPYRDYVISAFNKNKSFDAFLREQLAGDLLDDPTQDQLVATCYNRLLQTSHEGGAQLKEYRAIYMADRVRNVSQVFMGATVGCAQCHSHKFDPYSHKDFHALGAFFADVEDEEHLVNQYGNLNTLPSRRLPEMPIYTEAQQKRLAEISPKVEPLLPQIKNLQSAINGHSKAIADLTKKISSTKDEPKDKDSKKETPKEKLEKQLAGRKAELEKAKADLSALLAPVKAMVDEYHKITDSAPSVMYTKSLAEPRVVRILPRGNWLDETGEIVQPAVPVFMGHLKTGDRRANRLDLANWLVTPAAKGGVSGFTARVQVNRFWQLLMGTGIARVLDDFGGQGEPPEHPALLDHLAVEFEKSDWDVKQMIKTIVMSKAYRQSSVWTSELRERDPDNRLYARQSSPRLSAEFVRDNALFISGLLVDDIGGPSVNPYQPAGYYGHLNFPTRKYQQHTDARQWRRGMYMHWQRQFLHPMLKAFDAPTREECTAGRPESNTPTQALVLLNDPTFVEAARVFAMRILSEGGKSDEAQINYAFRWVASRFPEPREVVLMKALLTNHRKHFKANPDQAAKVITTGLTPAPKDVDQVELAAWTSIARTLLNLNETITRN